jgi:hypothetical protein
VADHPPYLFDRNWVEPAWVEDEKKRKTPSASSGTALAALPTCSAESSVAIHHSAKICWKDRGSRDDG